LSFFITHIFNMEVYYHEELVREAEKNSKRLGISVQQALDSKANRLTEVCQNTLKLDHLGHQEKLTLQKVRLSWELLSHRAQTLRKLLDAIGAMTTRSKWDESRLVFLTRLIQHTHLTGQIVQAGCISDTYGDTDTQNALQFMGQLLDKKIQEATDEVQMLTNHLVTLDHMPPHLVKEHHSIQEAIREKLEHINRLISETA